MSIKIGINGFGRIGKFVFRLACETPHIEVVHVNDMMGIDMMAHLLKYDSLHGKFNSVITKNSNHIIVDNKKIIYTNNTSPTDIPWHQSGAEIIIDASGRFKNRKALQGHINNGVKKVILSCPADDDSIDRTVVMGVNNKEILPTDTIISNASCTTNCVAIMLKVLIEEFGLQYAFMNTVHPFTNNQNLQDGYHSDFRRARAAYNNIIPTTSSAIKTIHKIFPDFKNSFNGFATRVPIADCSFAELTAQTIKDVSIDSINNAFKKYSENNLKSYLEYCNEPIVSSDITNNTNSAIFDSLMTKVIDKKNIQIIAWYDNEYGYSSRIIDLIKYIHNI